MTIGGACSSCTFVFFVDEKRLISPHPQSSLAGVALRRHRLDLTQQIDVSQADG
jgi:hypothetical protein